MMLQTEYPFALPKGFVDENGEVHKKGTMRLATAADEICPMDDHRVKQNSSYLTVILLSRVVTNLEGLSDVNPKIVEKLFVEDFTFLQTLYREINGNEELALPTTCPECNVKFDVSLTPGEL